MKKLLDGIAEFHEKLRPGYRETFARLALGQSPDCLFFACSDSRVVPNLFASTQPGDLFVVRNVGNMVPPCLSAGGASADRSSGAAVEFAVLGLGVRDIVVCGHSDCGAMRALTNESTPEATPNLHAWLDTGRHSLLRLAESPQFARGLAPHNRLGQINVLQQLEHLKTYPCVAERLSAGQLTLHAWWFDLTEVEVHAYDPGEGRFVALA